MKFSARWLIALALIACALAAWSTMPPPEPTCEGEPLSKWIRKNYGFDDQFDLMVRRIRSLGPPAVARLAYLAEHGELEGDDRGIIGKFLVKIRSRRVAVQHDERLEAITILGGIGPDAKAAIPALRRVLATDHYDHVYAAAAALHQIGPDSWPAIEDQLLRGSNLARCALLKTMSWRHPFDSSGDYAKIFKFLTAALRDPEPNIRRNASSSLAVATSWAVFDRIPGPIVDEAATALWPLPDESNKEVREAKQAVLIYYGKTSVESLPRLAALLADPDEANRSFARLVLGQLSAP